MHGFPTPPPRSLSPDRCPGHSTGQFPPHIPHRKFGTITQTFRNRQFTPQDISHLDISPGTIPLDISPGHLPRTISPRTFPPDTNSQNPDISLPTLPPDQLGVQCHNLLMCSLQFVVFRHSVTRNPSIDNTIMQVYNAVSKFSLAQYAHLWYAAIAGATYLLNYRNC